MPNKQLLKELNLLDVDDPELDTIVGKETAAYPSGGIGTGS